MENKWFAKALLLAVLGVLLSSSPAQAIVIDWNALTWTGGSLTQTFYATNSAFASTSANKGIYYADDWFAGRGSVTITISDTTGALTGGFPAIDNTTATGGTSPAQDSLQFNLNFASQPDTITISVVFSNYPDGVDSVVNTLFNIDAAGNLKSVDQVSGIYAIATNGTAVASTITGSADNQVAGSGTNQTITGTSTAAATSAAGNATIDFGTNIIDQTDFTFGNDPSAHSNPGGQTFSLNNITFRPRLPEYGSTFAALLICALAALYHRRKSV